MTGINLHLPTKIFQHSISKKLQLLIIVYSLYTLLSSLHSFQHPLDSFRDISSKASLGEVLNSFSSSIYKDILYVVFCCVVGECGGRRVGDGSVQEMDIIEVIVELVL